MTGDDVIEKELRERVGELEESVADHLGKIVAVEGERDEYLGDLKRGSGRVRQLPQAHGRASATRSCSAQTDG